MSARSDVLVVGGGPVGACAARALAADGASVTLIEKEAEVCPPTSGAHGNCGLLVPSDVTPLAAPGVLGQGLRWMLDDSSRFYIAPRPSGALLRWLWLYRAAATPAKARAAERVMGVRAADPARRIWRGPRPVTPDGLPVVGRVPRRERVILAAGHCMIGLSLAPITGKLVAEIAGDRRPSLDLSPLSPVRFG